MNHRLKQFQLLVAAHALKSNTSTEHLHGVASSAMSTSTKFFFTVQNLLMDPICMRDEYLANIKNCVRLLLLESTLACSILGWDLEELMHEMEQTALKNDPSLAIRLHDNYPNGGA